MSSVITINYKSLLVKNDPIYPELMRALAIVANFIKKNKLILVGGMALDMALRMKNTSIYDDDELPDYDFYSPDSYQDAIKLGKEFCKAKLPNVSIIRGMHITTMRVRINFVPVADITYCPKIIFDNQLETLNYQGFRVLHPHYQIIDQHIAFAYPYRNPQLGGNVILWKKYSSRLEIILTTYPLPMIGFCENETFNYEFDPKIFKDICIAGYAAHSFYDNTAEIVKNKLVLKMHKPELTILTDTFDDTVKMLEKNFKTKASFYSPYLGRFQQSALMNVKNSLAIKIYDNKNDYVGSSIVKIGNFEFNIVSVNWTQMYYLHIKEYCGYCILQENNNCKNSISIKIDPDIRLPITYYGKNNIPDHVEYSKKIFDNPEAKILVPKNIYPELNKDCEAEGIFLYDNEYFEIDGEMH